jgi:hypothetical protein
LTITRSPNRQSLRFARLVALTAAVLFAQASPVLASGGYFCVGPDYLAFEFADGSHTPAGRAGLYVVALNGPEGFSDPVVFEFKPGDVRAMRCGARQVQLLDRESIATVDLDGPRTNVPLARARLPVPDAQPDGFVPLNLGELSHVKGMTWPEDVPLPRTARFSYALAPIKQAGVPQNHLFGCYPAMVTYLQQLDANRHVVRSLELAAGCDLSEDQASPPKQ